jgi:hypothetical protein
MAVVSIDDVRSCTRRTRDTMAATGTTRRIQQAKNLPNPIRTEAVVGGNMEDCRNGLPRLSLRAKYDAINFLLIS